MPKDRKSISNFISENHTPILVDFPLFGISPIGVVLIQMKSPNKYTFSSKHRCAHRIISRRSLKLSVGEVIVLVCTSNSQSMSSKLQLEVSEHEIRFLFMPTRSKTNVNSLYLALGFMKNIFLKPLRYRGPDLRDEVTYSLMAFCIAKRHTCMKSLQLNFEVRGRLGRLLNITCRPPRYEPQNVVQLSQPY